MEGGRFLKEGSYGCAFLPHLKCVGNDRSPHRKNNVLGKVFNKEEDFQYEKQLLEWMQSIDPNNTFTLPYHGHCKVDMRNQHKSDEIDRCRKTNDSQAILPELLLEFGGKDMETVMDHPEAYSRLALDDILHKSLPILKGLNILAKHKRAHLDIKPPNVLYDESKEKMFLIDFGLMNKIVEVKELDWMLSSNYAYYPPEFKVLYIRRFMTGMPLTNVKWIQSFILNSVGNIRNERFLPFVKSLTGLDYAQVLFEYVKKQSGVKTEDFTKAFDLNTTFDVYGLGMTLLEIAFEWFIKGAFRVRNGSFVRDAFTRVVSHMIHPDPSLRLGPKQAYQALTDLFKKTHRTTKALKSHPITISPSPIFTPPKEKKSDERIKSRNSSPLPMAKLGSVAAVAAMTPNVAAVNFPTAVHLHTPHVSREDLKRCYLTKRKGGFSINELRAFAVQHQIYAKFRTDICAAISRRLMPPRGALLPKKA